MQDAMFNSLDLAGAPIETALQGLLQFLGRPQCRLEQLQEPRQRHQLLLQQRQRQRQQHRQPLIRPFALNRLQQVQLLVVLRLLRLYQQLVQRKKDQQILLLVPLQDCHQRVRRLLSLR